jgi:tRNA/tmRNA/rRNA uracil-C5-methylase (TrmA/RlmC/RlmD family)
MLRQQAPSSELFYISCNPHRLLEELDDLSASYRLLSYQAFDFFPQTHHVELLLHFQAHGT